MSRYEEADEGLVEVFLNVLDEHFSSLQYLKFKLVFDLKKRIKAGKLLMANIEVPGPKLRYFSRDKVAAEGYDFIIFVDKKAWELAGTEDRKRLIRHELRHVFIDEKGDAKLIGHDLEDFYAEIELNKDNPRWGQKLATLVKDVYEQEKMMIKESGKKEI